MRKVKFTQDSFDEKLGAILNEFPMLDVHLTLVLVYFLETDCHVGPSPIHFVSHERSL